MQIANIKIYRDMRIYMRENKSVTRNYMENMITYEESTIKVKGAGSTVLYDEIIPLVRDAAMLNRKKFIQFVNSYIDQNSEGLFILGPYNRVLFIEARHSDPLFAMMGVAKNQIKDIVKKSPDVESGWATLNNPFFWLVAALAQIYHDPSDKLSMEAKSCAMIFMATRFYSSSQGHRFKYPPNKDIMAYTINNLSNKFLFKTEGSVYKVLVRFVEDNDGTAGTSLRKTHYDGHFKFYITNVSTKINNILAKIYVEYIKNHSEKKFLGSETERYDDEKNTMKELQNVSSVIESIAQRTYLKLKENGINSTIFDDAINVTKLKASAVRNTLEDIFEHETDLLKEEIVRILQLFFIDAKHTSSMIKTKGFRMWAMSIYKISNTNDRIIVRQKEILDGWVKKYGEQYVRFSRTASLLNFRKAIFIYIVDSIILYS